MWEELNVVKAIKNRKNEENIDVCLHKDKKNPKKNLYWRVQVPNPIFLENGQNKSDAWLYKRTPSATFYGLRSENNERFSTENPV